MRPFVKIIWSLVVIIVLAHIALFQIIARTAQKWMTDPSRFRSTAIVYYNIIERSADCFTTNGRPWIVELLKTWDRKQIHLFLEARHLDLENNVSYFLFYYTPF